MGNSIAVRKEAKQAIATMWRMSLSYFSSLHQYWAEKVTCSTWINHRQVAHGAEAEPLRSLFLSHFCPLWGSPSLAGWLTDRLERRLQTISCS
jgi:hypothetical protein